LQISGYETVMEGADMRALVLTLDVGQSVPWHYHSEITDRFYCLRGPMVVETLSPRVANELRGGESCVVGPGTVHCVHGKSGGPCQFLVLQGVGVYDNIPLAG
jgi:quercetin dioxygenase-like cupin family protein